MANLATTSYKKLNSFESTRILNRRSSVNEQLKRAVEILSKDDKNLKSENFANFSDVIKRVKISINYQNTVKDPNLLGSVTEFFISELIAEEMSTINDENLKLYLFHRFRYEVFPQEKTLDQFPPYIQIEPSSICNYRCSFCYQTDKSFSNNKSSHMGTMNFDTYKYIIDLIEGKTEFLSLASRGEPFICKDLPRMLAYSANKFLNLKINTNASLLNEERIHALLSGGAKTIVFSIDAPTKELYESLRVNGRMENIIKKLNLFKTIRENHFKNNKVLVRVSGVYVDKRQNMDEMEKVWGEFVDQITFVKYNPWENVYESPLSEIKVPCSDLWRRLFIWHDGKLNPCDTDYKSTLQIGNLKDFSKLNNIWRSNIYEDMRLKHISERRDQISPCNKCVVI